MRTPAQEQIETLQLLPPGAPFACDADDYMAARLLGWNNEMSLAEAAMEAMLPQVDIRLAFNLLPDYQRVLGPDPCGRDIQDLPFDEQAAIAFEQWTAGGDICAGYFVNLAAGLGETITIEEVVCWECSVACCDDLMVPAGQNFVWQVNLATSGLTNFECGVATCDDSLGLFEENPAQCPIEHQAPLHTTPVFFYTS